jgi:tetratricopeptide (TPR) repeat protein
MKITKAARSRVDAYVVKPFRAKVLQEKIQTVLNGEIDPSVAEFEEGLLPEVPSNQQLAEKKNHGKVLLDKEQKGAGILANLKRLAAKGPQKIGKVKVKDDTASGPENFAAEENEIAENFKEKVFEGGVIPTDGPPENYDLNKMSVGEIIQLAKEYIKISRFDKSIRLCTDAHFIYSNSADILFHLALAYRGIGGIESAIDQLKKAVKIDPYNIEVQTLLSDLELEKKAG